MRKFVLFSTETPFEIPIYSNKLQITKRSVNFDSRKFKGN